MAPSNKCEWKRGEWALSRAKTGRAKALRKSKNEVDRGCLLMEDTKTPRAPEEAEPLPFLFLD